jgi:hypothetical protein
VSQQIPLRPAELNSATRSDIKLQTSLLNKT